MHCSSARLCCLLGCLLAAGCATRVQVGSKAAPAATLAAEALGSEVQPGPVLIELGDMPAEPEPAGRAGRTYRGLAAGDCQCLAVEQSSLAKLLESEERVLRAQQGGGLGHGQPTAALALKRSLLALAAEDARNDSAAKALELYYRILESEAQFDLQTDAADELASVLEKLAQLRRQGEEVDPAAQERKHRDLLQQQVALAHGLDELNAALLALLRAERTPERLRIWPESGIRVHAEIPDATEAVAEGLARNPELRMLRLARRQLHADTLPAVRQMLATAHPLLGTEPRALKAVVGLALPRQETASELSGRRAQIADHLAQREAQVAAEIRQAVDEIAAAKSALELARLNEASWRQELARAQAEKELEELPFVRLSSARLGLIEAKAETTRRAVAWQRAWVRLRSAQGILAAECGRQTTIHCHGAGGCRFLTSGSPPASTRKAKAEEATDLFPILARRIQTQVDGQPADAQAAARLAKQSAPAQASPATSVARQVKIPVRPASAPLVPQGEADPVAR